MYQLSTIHEKHLTPFHRSQFLITVNDLKDITIFKDNNYSSKKFFSVEMNKRFFSNASQETIANLLLTTLQIKFQQGERNFLVVYNDDNFEESMDILNGLLHIFRLDNPYTQQAVNVTTIAEYAGRWAQILKEEEKGLSRIGILLNN